MKDPTDIARLLGAITPRMAPHRAMSIAEFAVLMTLVDESETVAVVDVQKLLGVGWGIATVSELVDALAKNGLVEKKRHQFDHRKTVVRLTPKGWRVVLSGRRVPWSREATKAARKRKHRVKTKPQPEDLCMCGHARSVHVGASNVFGPEKRKVCICGCTVFWRGRTDRLETPIEGSADT